MRIQVLQVFNKHAGRSNKDTNGGYGTVNEFGEDLLSRILMRVKRSLMDYPELLPGYVSSILKQLGHTVTYSENQLDKSADVILIPTSITNFNLELSWGKKIKELNPEKRVGFIGAMITGNPELYEGKGDFRIMGEPENIIDKVDLSKIEGDIEAGNVTDLNNVPFPDWDHIDLNKSRYTLPGRQTGRSFPVLGSRGCPMSCKYYCTYPLVQGTRVRSRSPENIFEELTYLRQKYQMERVLFRDPIFSIDIDRIDHFCELILSHDFRLNWVCETHPRFLNAGLIQKMAAAGCDAIKIGIESGNSTVMRNSNRIPDNLVHQEAMIRECEKNGIDVLGFYILGYFHDSPDTIQETINYAVKLNTYGAQFTIATPYPGTPWFKTLTTEKEDFGVDQNLENYTQYKLVYKHPALTKEQLEQYKRMAYRRYYYRWSYFKKHLLQGR